MGENTLLGVGLMFALLIAVVVALASAGPNNKPIVGIVTQPLEQGWSPSYGTHYIAASYVKYAEASGARVVPIFYNGTTEYLERMFQSVNAVLFPGGGQVLDHSKLLATTKFFLDKATASASTGDYFPVFGHCQGFEALLMAITGLELEQCMTDATAYRAENVSLSLSFTGPVESSNWFREMPDDVQTTLQTNSTLNNHIWSVSPDQFAQLQSTTALKNFRALSTTTSPQGKSFISTYEGREAPVYAMQFHAEKSIFEWPHENIDHSTEAVAAMAWLSRHLGSEARKSTHAFASPEEEKAALIYNWNPVFSIGFCNFDQVYFWQ